MAISHLAHHYTDQWASPRPTGWPTGWPKGWLTGWPTGPWTSPCNGPQSVKLLASFTEDVMLVLTNHYFR